MTFKHKLSRRLALLRNVFLVGVCVVAACSLQEILSFLSSISVSPAAATVPIGGTVQFTATVLDANGAARLKNEARR